SKKRNMREMPYRARYKTPAALFSQRLMGQEKDMLYRASNKAFAALFAEWLMGQAMLYSISLPMVIGSSGGACSGCLRARSRRPMVFAIVFSNVKLRQKYFNFSFPGNLPMS